MSALRLMSLVAVSACASRPITYASAPCASWTDGIAAVFATRCATCHSGATPAGGYDVTTYAGAIAGDEPMKVLSVLDPAHADAVHQPVSDVHAQALSWVQDCNLSFFDSPVHPGGILNPADPDFHGTLVKNLGWSMSSCAQCHGADLLGGTSGVSCWTCHEGGPTSCTGCHAQPPATGAHVAHALGPTLGKKLACTECHLTPTLYTDVGHLLEADGTPVPAPAQITFGALASTKRAVAAPTWNPPAGSCNNVWCHGDAFGTVDTKALVTRPLWTGPPGQATCGTCHGNPPSSHVQGLPCRACHEQTVDATGKLTARHLDGLIEIGDGTGTCTSCHGNDANPLSAPHASHLNASHRLSGPVACADCHIVPAALDDPGHLDGGGPVITFMRLATTGGAQPSWTPATLTCSGTYCHGGGAALAQDVAPGQARTPTWKLAGDQAYCGACHGIPPRDGVHAAGLALTDCVTCHAKTVDAFGNIVVVAGASAHMNGVVDGN